MISGKSKFAVLILVAGVSGSAQAALHDRGGGLIYDDVLNVTWLQDVTYAQTSGTGGATMSWNNAVIWAASLGYYDSVRGRLLTGWRLPSVSPLNGVDFNYIQTRNGSSDVGYNISAPGSLFGGSTASELAYMYYVNLGNKNVYSPTTGEIQAGAGLVNTGPFLHLEPGYQWSGNGYVRPDLCQPGLCAWMFSTQDYGLQTLYGRGGFAAAWAVRDGDVIAVPEPESYATMLAGLCLVGAIARRRRDHNA